MKLTDLDPRWVADGDGRRIGVSFICPHCKPSGGDYRLAVGFANPIGSGPADDGWHVHWQRAGEAFETLTLAPSIDASKSGHWHGFITNGEVT